MLPKHSNIKNTRIWSITGRRNWRKKRSIGMATTRRKRGGEEIVISQAGRVLNLPWYGVSYMHIKDSRFIG